MPGTLKGLRDESIAREKVEGKGRTVGGTVLETIIINTASNAVVGGDISGTVGNAQIVAGAVDTTELADDAVTNDKVDTGISADKLVDGSTNHVFTASDDTKLAGIEAGADVTDADNVGSTIHGATAKTTPVDADTMPLIDSAASNVLKKVTWANIKATLKTYFDTLYSTTTTFLGLSDTPSDYTGNAGKIPQVNATEDGLQFTDNLGADLAVDTLTVEEQFILNGILSATVSGHLTDYAPTGHAAKSIFILNFDASGPYELRSLAGGSDGRVVLGYNNGTTKGTIKDNYTSGTTASMRFDIPHDIDWYPGEWVIFIYNANVGRWHVLSLYGLKIGSGGAELVRQLDIANTSTITLALDTLTNGVQTLTADLVYNVSLVTGTTHTLGSTEHEVQFKLGAGCAVALPPLSGLPVGWRCRVRDINNNIAANNVTFNRDGSDVFTSGATSWIWATSGASADLVVADWGGGAKRWYHE